MTIVHDQAHVPPMHDVALCNADLLLQLIERSNRPSLRQPDGTKLTLVTCCGMAAGVQTLCTCTLEGGKLRIDPALFPGLAAAVNFMSTSSMLASSAISDMLLHDELLGQDEEADAGRVVQASVLQVVSERETWSPDSDSRTVLSACFTSPAVAA